MSDTETLDRPEVEEKAQGAKGASTAPSYTDFGRKHYVDERNMLRQRLMDGIGNMRRGDAEQKKFSRQFSYEFFKAGIGTTLNLYSAIRNPMKMVSWAFNLLETGLQLKNNFKNHGLVSAGFERDKGAYQGAIKDYILFSRQAAPMDDQGRSLKADFSMFAPDDIVAKFVPAEIAHRDMHTGEVLEMVPVREMKPLYKGPFAKI